jgi:hypothetical protein
MLTLESEVPFSAPYFSDDLDGFGESFEGRTRCPSRTPIRFYGIPKASCSQSQFESPAAQQVEAGGSFGKDRRRT